MLVLNNKCFKTFVYWLTSLLARASRKSRRGFGLNFQPPNLSLELALKITVWACFMHQTTSTSLVFWNDIRFYSYQLSTWKVPLKMVVSQECHYLQCPGGWVGSLAVTTVWNIWNWVTSTFHHVKIIFHRPRNTASWCILALNNQGPEATVGCRSAEPGNDLVMLSGQFHAEVWV